MVPSNWRSHAIWGDVSRVRTRRDWAPGNLIYQVPEWPRLLGFALSDVFYWHREPLFGERYYITPSTESGIRGYKVPITAKPGAPSSIQLAGGLGYDGSLIVKDLSS